MIEKTALGQIIDFINDKKLTQMMKWSDRSIFCKNRHGYSILNNNVRKIKNGFQKILNLISGNDSVEFLKSLFFFLI